MSHATVAGTAYAVLSALRPQLLWDSVAGTLSNLGSTKLQAVDDDALPSSALTTVWNPGTRRLEQVTCSADKVLGRCGQFSDGSENNLWTNGWAGSALGFVTIAGVSPGVGIADSTVLPACADASVGTVHSARVNTNTGTSAQWVYVKAPVGLHATYRRAVQILVQSDSATAPSQCALAMHTNLITDTVAQQDTHYASTVRNWLPQQQDNAPAARWFALRQVHPAYAAGTGFVWLRLPNNSGSYTLALPSLYSAFSTFEAGFRCPVVPGSSRGMWRLQSVSATERLPVAGWLALSLTLPEASISRGHYDYDQVANYGFASLFTWAGSTERLRLILSDQLDRLAVQMDISGTSFAFLDLASDWWAWERLGVVVTWGISNGKNYANLYVNGAKLDSVFESASWFSGAQQGRMYIGADATPASADAWIQRVAMGRRPLHRSQAAALSVAMQLASRAGGANELDEHGNGLLTILWSDGAEDAAAIAGWTALSAAALGRREWGWGGYQWRGDQSGGWYYCPDPTTQSAQVVEVWRILPFTAAQMARTQRCRLQAILGSWFRFTDDTYTERMRFHDEPSVYLVGHNKASPTNYGDGAIWNQQLRLSDLEPWSGGADTTLNSGYFSRRAATEWQQPTAGVVALSVRLRFDKRGGGAGFFNDALIDDVRVELKATP